MDFVGDHCTVLRNWWLGIGNSPFLSKLLSSPQYKPWGVKKLAWPNDFGAGGSKGPLQVRVQLPLQLLLLRKGSKGVWASTNATETRLKGLLQNLPPNTDIMCNWVNQHEIIIFIRIIPKEYQVMDSCLLEYEHKCFIWKNDKCVPLLGMDILVKFAGLLFEPKLFRSEAYLAWASS